MTRSKKVFVVSAAAFVVICALGATAIALYVRESVRRTPVLLRTLGGSPPNVNSFVVTSPQGVRVFLDVVSMPADLEPAVDDPRSIFLVTHRHADHLAGPLARRFLGTRLVAEEGKLASGDVHVEMMRSSHHGDELDGTDHIAVVEVGGIRIAHFGDCGQARLTPEQRARLGRVDVMIGQLENGFSEADVGNRKAFRLLAEVAPALFVPTHVASAPAIELLRADRAVEQTPKAELALTPAALAKGKRALLLGGNRPLADRAGVPQSQEF